MAEPSTDMLRKRRLRVEGYGEIASIPGPFLHEVLEARGVDLHDDCGGRGKCGKCRVVFLDAAPEPTRGDRTHLNETELAEGVRLACFTPVTRDCELRIPPPRGGSEPELLDDLPE